MKSTATIKLDSKSYSCFLSNSKKKKGGGGTLPESLSFLVSHKSCRLDFLSKIARFSLVALTSPAMGPRARRGNPEPYLCVRAPVGNTSSSKGHHLTQCRDFAQSSGHPQGPPKDSETPRGEQHEEKCQVPLGLMGRREEGRWPDPSSYVLRQTVITWMVGPTRGAEKGATPLLPSCGPSYGQAQTGWGGAEKRSSQGSVSQDSDWREERIGNVGRKGKMGRSQQNWLVSQNGFLI